MTSWAPSRDGAAGSPDRTAAQVRERFASPARGRAFWPAMWALVAVLELLALRPVLLDRAEPIEGLAVVFTLIGGSFAAFGLVAWRRRPDSRSGLLMTATGIGFV